MWKGMTNFLESVDQKAAEGFKASPRNEEKHMIHVDYADEPPAIVPTIGSPEEMQVNGIDISLQNGGLGGRNINIDTTGVPFTSSRERDDDEDPWTLDYGDTPEGHSAPSVTPNMTATVEPMHTAIPTAAATPPFGISTASHSVITASPPLSAAQRTAVGPKAPSVAYTPLPLPPSASFPSGNRDMTSEIETLRKEIDILKRAEHDTQSRYEKALTERDNRFLLLEGDFEVVVARNKGLSVEVQYLNQHLNEAKSEKEIATEALEEARAAVLREQETARKQKEDISKLEDLVKESHTRQDRMQENLEIETRKREHIEEVRDAIQAQLDDYKTKSKMLLNEKERSIEQLEAELQRVANLGTRGEGGDDLRHNGRDSEGGALYTKERVDAAVLKAQEDISQQYTETIFILEEKAAKLQQDLKQKTSSEQNRIDEIEALKLHNSQLRDMYEGEQNVNRTTTQKIKKTLEEKEGHIIRLEKTLKELHISNAVMRPVAEQHSGSDTGVSSGCGKSYQDVERRARELADALLEKQAALEAKRAEADQWRTRYEVGQQRLREAELVSKAITRGGKSSNSAGGSHTGHRYSNDIGIAESGGMDSHHGGEFKESRWYSVIASKGSWGRHAAGAASKIDHASLRLGIILRRNSLLRIVVVVYFVLVQLYLFIVLSISPSVPEGTKVHEASAGLEPMVK